MTRKMAQRCSLTRAKQKWEKLSEQSTRKHMFWKENKPTKTVNISSMGKELQFPVREMMAPIFVVATWRVSALKCSPRLPTRAAHPSRHRCPAHHPERGVHEHVKQ